MDLDLFKDVNDSFGHEAGDQVLKQAAARLNQTMRESDTVARLGGDEFAAILMSIHSDRDAISVIGKIIKSIAQPFNIGDRLVNIGISIGYSFCPKHSNDSTTLLRFADIAMYQAKQTSKGFCQYDAGNDSALKAVSITTQDIRDAISQDQLVVHYQPQLDLNSSEIIDQLKEAKMDPEKLCLEVTETAVMQSPELALTSLNALSEAGIRLFIDDFGTGYSSLKYLKISENIPD
jgi:diguanylate cyclase (GGDEF)-like protein